MIPLIYKSNVLLSIQCALCNAITPQLRAVTACLDERKHELNIAFFYDCEVTDELYEIASVALTEVDVDASDHYIINEQHIKLTTSNQIPIDGKLVYLRKELIFPVYAKENRSYLLSELTPLVVFRLDMQEALLGRVTPTLRLVSIGLDDTRKTLISQFIYDGQISKEDYNLATSTIHESVQNFPDYKLNSTIESVNHPNYPILQGEWTVYLRREVIY